MDQKGHYRLKDVMAGQYTMTIRASGRQGMEVHRQTVYISEDRDNIQPAISLMLGSFAGTVLPEGVATDNLQARKRLRGNVQLLPGISEMPRDWREFRRDNLVYGQPVQRGRFRFEKLPLGEYLMVLRVHGFAPRTQQVYVDGSPVAQEYRTGKRRRPTKAKPGPKGKGKPKPKGKAKPKPKPKPKGKPGR